MAELDRRPTRSASRVRDRYAAAATNAGTGKLRLLRRSTRGRSPTTARGVRLGPYDGDDRDALPEAAKLASLGCGNPTAVADLNEGETVLDLGSGGGIDVLLSARRVGPTGKAYGLDMTDEMLDLARAQPGRGRGRERRVRQGHDRGDPAPGRLASTSSSPTA